VFAYFKHEALGPLFAEALLASTSGREMADLSAIRAAIAAPPAKPPSTRARASKVPTSKPPKPVAEAAAKPAPSSDGAQTPAARAAKGAPKTPAPRAPSARKTKKPT
jgi:hypothetical protein